MDETGAHASDRTPTLVAHSFSETGSHFVYCSVREMPLDFVCILLSEGGAHLRTEHSGFESSAQTLQSSICFLFEAFLSGGVVIAVEATRFTTQHSRFNHTQDRFVY